MDLASFILTTSSKYVNELIEKTWKMQDAAEKLDREEKARLDIMREQMGKECTTGCNKDWLKCTLEVRAEAKQSAPICLCSCNKRSTDKWERKVQKHYDYWTGQLWKNFHVKAT